jgi:hypothetical protein
MSPTGQYLFAVTDALEPDDLRGQEGFDGEPLELVEHAGLQAVVCAVDLDEFGEVAVHRNLENLPWVERVARTHDADVRTVAARSTTAPLRLVTICLDQQSVVSRLQEWEPQLRAALDRVRGCQEWSVKAYAVEPGSAAEPPSPQAGHEGSGAAYLRRKRDEADRRQSRRAAAAETARELHAAIAGRSDASRVLAAQDPQLTGRAEAMILNGAYLVPDSESQQFLDVVEVLHQRHADVALEVAGPWAPYSFAVLEPSDADD